MSYILKNDTGKQIEFLDKTILPIYGIKNIIDYTTEIDTRLLQENKTFLSNITEKVPEIKKLFKTSTMGLDRKGGKVDTEQYALALLKNMCKQARILFDITKYKNKFTFALTPENLILKAYIRSNYIDILAERVITRSEAETKTTTVQTLLSLPSFKFEKLVWLGEFPFDSKHPLCDIFLKCGNWTDVVTASIIDQRTSMETMRNVTTELITVSNNKSGYITLPKIFDILIKIKEVYLTNKNGDRKDVDSMKLVDRRRDTIISVVIDDYVAKELVNFPIYSRPESSLELFIPEIEYLEDKYKVVIRLEGTYLQHKYYKLKCK